MIASGCCPGCTSPLLQPLRWRPDGLEVRCPDCQTCARIPCTDAEAAAFDRLQREHRAELQDAYERCVGESMALLADCLAEALARDLIGADDFR